MLEKSILAIVLGYVVLTFSGNADASQNTHCIDSGTRSVCYSYDTDTGVRSKTVVSSAGSNSTWVITTDSTGYRTKELKVVSGRVSVVSGSDNKGGRWSSTAIATGIDISDTVSIADTTGIADEMSIQR